MEEIKITFDNEGMQFDIKTTPEHYTQAVYALIGHGFERFGKLDKLCLLGALYKAIKLYPQEDDYGDSEIYS